ncbi:tetratricopeptide repeat protein [Paradesertivirga mongoliensis]|uniref:Tetratricopeptide repeat protein n=1 Tax=Paradesertivirga mongoliensis TaxID=2100740 RepID=A0ABW4ZI24_9SPHI|nr:tetratricopeptide repeat protein [Pedobacter mongoliensis]
MMKKILCIAALAVGLQPVLAIDTAALKKTVLIGPPELVLPPPVDSALLKKLLVTERLKKKVSEEADFKNRQNLLLLNSLLIQTETAVEPDASLIGTLEQALTEYIRTRDVKSQALVYNTYGVYYGRYGQPEKATYYFNEALKIKESLKDNAGVAKIAENLTAIYKINGQYDLAIKCAEYFVAANMAQKKTALAAKTYLDIASMKFKQNKFKESEYYILKKAFPLFQRTGNKQGRMNCFQSLADLYFHQQRYSEAKWFYIQSQIMATKLFDNQAMISSLTGLGKVKNALGEHADALENYRQAERLALRNNYLVKLVEINADLGEMYSRLGDYPAAGAALDQYNRFRENWIKTNKL